MARTLILTTAACSPCAILPCPNSLFAGVLPNYGADGQRGGCPLPTSGRPAHASSPTGGPSWLLPYAQMIDLCMFVFGLHHGLLRRPSWLNNRVLLCPLGTRVCSCAWTPSCRVLQVCHAPHEALPGISDYHLLPMLRGHGHSRNLRVVSNLDRGNQFLDVRICYHQRLFDPRTLHCGCSRVPVTRANPSRLCECIWYRGFPS